MCVTYKKFCCCCCNVVTCSKVFAIIGLIGGILSVIGGFLSLAGVANFYLKNIKHIPYGINMFVSLGYYGFIGLSIFIEVVWMIPDVLLLIGISKKKPGFMMVWLVVKMILLVLFTIYSAVAIIGLIPIANRYPGSLIITAIILALVNALGYYLWEIVRSAYKQIKEENKNVQPAGNYQMNTYEKSPPAQYNHHV